MCASRVVTFPRLWKKAHDNPTDFTAWTALLDLVEKQQNIENARMAFESFFKHFPNCYGYWKKWADMEKHKGFKEESLEVYKAGVKAIPLSIDLWTAYLDAATEFYHGKEDYETQMRSLYEEAIEIAGLEFRSDALWEHYISWETSHNRLTNVVDIYTRLLQRPTQLYFQNWDSFNKLIEENRPEDILSANEFARLLAQVSLNSVKTASAESQDGGDAQQRNVEMTNSTVEITDAVRNSIRELLIASREQLYQSTYTQIMKRWFFEEKIRRPYFHVKPLEEVQLTNWAEYLSFEEAEAAAVCSQVREQYKTTNPSLSEDEEKLEEMMATSDVVKLAKRRVRLLYERCLVPCALYEHFWIRYARYLEITERDIAGAREVWRRACTIHLPYKPTIHWHWGCFEDHYPSNLDVPPTYPVRTCLDILTQLEERLTDSALVCCRRADAMRRAKKPLFDIIACLRSGINRLRYLAEDQTKLAKSLSGPTASRTVAQAIATSTQARAGAGVLAGRLARLLHRGELTPDGIPLWMLLLHTVHDEDAAKVEDHCPVVCSEEGDASMEVEHLKSDEDNAHVNTSSITENGIENTHKSEESTQPSVSHDTLANGDSVEDTKQETRDDADNDSSSVESMKDQSDSDEDMPLGDQDEETGEDADMIVDECGSPPTILTDTSLKRKASGDNNDNKRGKKSRKNDGDNGDDKELDEAEKARKAEEERIQKEKELAAEEEERIRALLDKRQRLIHIPAPPEETLTAEDHQIVSGEDAAIRVLKEAIEYDPRNERLYAQLLDIVYQRRPVDVEGFIEVANCATIDSILPASIKLAFSQRKIQFLEEFDTDMCRLRMAYEEYLGLCDAVNTTVSASALARGTSRFHTGYPLPDLLNLPSASARMSSIATAGSGDTLMTAGPVVRQSCLTTDQAVLEAAASVGTPAPDPSTSAGYFTAGGYEPLAAALGNTSGLPPLVPAMAMTDPSAWAAAAAAAAAASDPYASYYYGAVTSAASAVPTSLDYSSHTTTSSAITVSTIST